MSFSLEVTEKVRQETSLDLHTWQATMSPQLGTITSARLVDSLEVLEQGQDKLAVSEPFMDLAEKGGKLFTGVDRSPAPAWSTASRRRTGQLPAYVSSARAVAANGRLGDAIAAGIEIAEASTRITGIQAHVPRGVHGSVRREFIGDPTASRTSASSSPRRRPWPPTSSGWR